MDLVISRICHTTCSLTLSSMGSSSRFTVEAMIRGYHEYKKGESMQLLKDCEEQLQLSCKWEMCPFIIQGAHKRLAAPDYVTLNKLAKKLGELCRFVKFAKVFYCMVIVLA